MALVKLYTVLQSDLFDVFIEYVKAKEKGTIH